MKTKSWALLNFAGIFLYICVASRNWSQESVPILFRTDDDLMRWLEFCLPLLALFALLNAIWLIFILLRFRNVRCWPPLFSWFLAAVLWMVVFKYDRYRFTRETAPLSRQEEQDIARDQAAARRSAQERLKQYEAAGIPPYRVDSAGAKYYHNLNGATPSIASGSGAQGLPNHAENPK